MTMTTKTFDGRVWMSLMELRNNLYVDPYPHAPQQMLDNLSACGYREGVDYMKVNPDAPLKRKAVPFASGDALITLQLAEVLCLRKGGVAAHMLCADIASQRRTVEFEHDAAIAAAKHRADEADAKSRRYLSVLNSMSNQVDTLKRAIAESTAEPVEIVPDNVADINRFTTVAI